MLILSIIDECYYMKPTIIFAVKQSNILFEKLFEMPISKGMYYSYI